MNALPLMAQEAVLVPYPLLVFLLPSRQLLTESFTKSLLDRKPMWAGVAVDQPLALSLPYLCWFLGDLG